MDVSSQLQRAIEQMGTDMCETLLYLNTKHDYLPFAGQQKVPYNEKDPAKPDDSMLFASTQTELAKQLVQRTQEIERLASSLPGLDRSETAQIDELRGLERDLSAQESKLERVLDERRLIQRELRVAIAKTCQSVNALR